MALFDRLNDFAKNLGEKTTEAIETGKLNSKISSERAAAAEELKKIGAYYYARYLDGEEVAEEVLEACAAAKAHHDAADEAQAEIDRIKAENEAAKAAAAAAQAAPAGDACPGCGTVNAPGTKFCQNCGTKLATPAPAGLICPECGGENPAGTKFCGSCGAKLELPAPRLCPGCSEEVPAGMKFCSNCGQKME